MQFVSSELMPLAEKERCALRDYSISLNISLNKEVLELSTGTMYRSLISQGTPQFSISYVCLFRF